MSRIQMTDTASDAMFKLCEGNPGGLTILLELYNKAVEIDPDSALQELGPMLLLNTFEIYGSNIWVLYKDCCAQDITNTIAVLRAVQMGLFSKVTLKAHILSCAPIDCKTLRDKLRAELPNSKF